MPDADANLEGLPDAALRDRAAVCLQGRDWSQAAALLGAVAELDVVARLQLNLARNMAAMQRWRPETYQRLLESPQVRPARVVALPGGALTIAQRRGAGAAEVVLSLNSDPQAALAAHQRQIAPAIDARLSLALCGIGDGYLLQWLAANHREGLVHEHGMARVVWVLEPDAEVLLAAMMLHDMTGPTGAIEQPRFVMFVGPTWASQMTELMKRDSMLPIPAAAVGQGLRAREALDSIEAARVELEREEARMAVQLERHYAQVTAEQLAALFGGRPPRRPRVMVMTSRFTMVLRHASEDMAAALERLGCDVHLLMEPNDCRRAWSYTLRKAVYDFRPDMAITIDHLRRESDPLFPKQLPFVCWLQDYFPYLTEKAAGRSVTRRDFVLTAGITECIEKFDYPARQCIELGKLTRVPPRPATWRSDGDDLVFVSNASGQPRALAEAFIAEAAKRSPDEAKLARACCDALHGLYAEGRHLNTMREIGVMIDRHAAAMRWKWHASDARDRFAFALFHPVNDALYRQQALGWAKHAAAARGLTLSIYGKGWDEHPDFKSHARGFVRYGSELEALTRRSKINLQIVPHSCLHQRLLDGLVAGGFFLVRSNPIDHYTRDLLTWFERHLPADAQSVGDVLTMTDGQAREAFAALMARRGKLMDSLTADPVARYRQRVRGGAAHFYDLPPGLDEVTFDSAATFESLIDRYLKDEAMRQSVAAAQRAFVASHYTYEAGMAYMLKQVGARLADEAADQRQTIKERVA